MGHPVASILIVNYNSGPFLAACLATLPGAFAPEEIEVLVADNASVDDSIAQAQKALPTATFIQTGANLGFGKAMNLLAQKATSPWLFLLNPDTSLEGAGWHEAMMSFLREHPRTGVLGPVIHNSDGSFQAACIRGEPTPWNSFCELSGLAKRFPTSKLLAGYHLGHLSRETAQPVDAVSGSGMFIRRKLFLEVGGFDEQFFLFAEDLDLCRKARGQHMEIWYNPALSLTHHKGKCSEARPAFVRHHFYRSMALYFDKYYNRGFGKILRPLVWAATKRLGPAPE